VKKLFLAAPMVAALAVAVIAPVGSLASEGSASLQAHGIFGRVLDEDGNTTGGGVPVKVWAIDETNLDGQGLPDFELVCDLLTGHDDNYGLDDDFWCHDADDSWIGSFVPTGFVVLAGGDSEWEARWFDDALTGPFPWSTYGTEDFQNARVFEVTTISDAWTLLLPAK